MAIVTTVLGGIAGFFAFTVSLFWLDYAVLAALGMYYAYAFTVVAVMAFTANYHKRLRVKAERTVQQKPTDG